MGAFLFLVGLPVMVASLAKLQAKAVTTHGQWDYVKICDAMRRAPYDAVVRIRQTWIPEEGFVTALRDIYINDDKRFKLDVLLIDPYGQDSADASALLAARVRLREGITATMAVQRVEATLDRFEGMATNAPTNAKTRRRVPVDLDIRLYDHLPFGPICQVGDDVMYVGLFVNFETSSDAPMLEIRNTPGNRWWRQFERELDEAWSAATPLRGDVNESAL